MKSAAVSRQRSRGGSPKTRRTKCVRLHICKCTQRCGEEVSPAVREVICFGIPLPSVPSCCRVPVVCRYEGVSGFGIVTIIAQKDRARAKHLWYMHTCIQTLPLRNRELAETNASGDLADGYTKQNLRDQLGEFLDQQGRDVWKWMWPRRAEIGDWRDDWRSFPLKSRAVELGVSGEERWAEAL